jgi:ADP-heptose:LPS heptosyltransferase
MKYNYLNHDIGIKLKNSNNIAIIKLAHIGDSVWMIPFIKNLKKNLPLAKLTVIVNIASEPLFLLNPYVDKVITYDLNTMKGIWSFYKFIKTIRDINLDAIFELTDSDRPAYISFLSGADYIIGYNNENLLRNRLYTHISSSLNQRHKNNNHQVEHHLNILTELGYEIFDTTIEFNLDPHCYKTLMEKIPELSNNNGKKIVVIHPGARNPIRQWGTDRFAQLCDLLYAKCMIILTAGPNEAALITEITRLMKTPLPIIAENLNLFEFAALCEASDLFIGNDSGPLHVAAAKNTFVAGFYGTALPEHHAPWTDKKIIIQNNDLECRPCYNERCKIPDFKKCLYSITPDEAFEQIKDVL